jgi:hypothetical protein
VISNAGSSKIHRECRGSHDMSIPISIRPASRPD